MAHKDTRLDNKIQTKYRSKNTDKCREIMKERERERPI